MIYLKEIMGNFYSTRPQNMPLREDQKPQFSGPCQVLLALVLVHLPIPIYNHHTIQICCQPNATLCIQHKTHNEHTNAQACCGIHTHPWLPWRWHPAWLCWAHPARRPLWHHLLCCKVSWSSGLSCCWTATSTASNICRKKINDRPFHSDCWRALTRQSVSSKEQVL